MSKHGQLLFQRPLQERLSMSASSKLAQLEAVCIAEHNFTDIHKQSPTQQTITEMLSACNNNLQLTYKDLDINAVEISEDWAQSDDWDSPNLI
eukprot:15365397-Ditylum_brightwellii.AAC.1